MTSAFIAINPRRSTVTVDRQWWTKITAFRFSAPKFARPVGASAYATERAHTDGQIRSWV